MLSRSCSCSSNFRPRRSTYHFFAHDGQPTHFFAHDGQPTSFFAHDGQPAILFVHDGQPTHFFAHDGQPTSFFVHDGQPTRGARRPFLGRAARGEQERSRRSTYNSKKFHDGQPTIRKLFTTVNLQFVSPTTVNLQFFSPTTVNLQMFSRPTVNLQFFSSTTVNLQFTLINMKTHSSKNLLARA